LFHLAFGRWNRRPDARQPRAGQPLDVLALTSPRRGRFTKAVRLYTRKNRSTQREPRANELSSAALALLAGPVLLGRAGGDGTESRIERATCGGRMGRFRHCRVFLLSMALRFQSHAM
jgi:hypothetical protein